ncbi:MAG: carboxypeptidase-like regulatory domain-containing protein [Acidobacteriia bacterium]|nr:carboxypeptidase-like regulatory domain-containing protein [Terriglobia bacterium]
MRGLWGSLRMSQFGISLIIQCALLACFMAGVCFDAAGQSDRGAIGGTILDISGAVVPGATITATGVETGIIYRTASTSEGVYRIPNMQVGAYNITVEDPGFKTSEQKGVVVQINSTAALDVVLQPGEVKQTVTVVASAPSLDTQTSDVGTVVDTRQIQDLPLAVNATGQSYLRSPEAFVFLTPGTAGPGTADSSSGIFQSKLAGGQEFGNEVILDGASTARSDSGSAFDQTAPSVEALDEFKVMTSTLPAQFGRTTGGAESFETKSGTNTFHGTAYDIFRNDDLDANPWFNNLYGAPVPLDKKNDYGGDLGGPLWIPKVYNGRDKTFFFFSWEQYRQTQGSTNVSTIPTLAERQGDFSGLLNTSNPLGTNPCDGSTIYQGQIFDPSTTQTVNGVQCRTAFPGNKMSTFSNVAQKILSYFPQPTNSNYINNFIYTTHNPILDTTMTFRIDQNLSPKSKLFSLIAAATRRRSPAARSSPIRLTPITSIPSSLITCGRDGIISSAPVS